jgi:hypothetical protein
MIPKLSTVPAPPAPNVLSTIPLRPALICAPAELVTAPPCVKEFELVPMTVPWLVRVHAWVVALMPVPALSTVTPGNTRAVVPADKLRLTPVLVLVVMSTSSACTVVPSVRIAADVNSRLRNRKLDLSEFQQRACTAHLHPFPIPSPESVANARR